MKARNRQVTDLPRIGVAEPSIESLGIAPGSRAVADTGTKACDTMPETGTLKVRTAMKQLKTILLTGLLVLGSNSFLKQPATQQDTKTIAIAGLKSSVTVRRDERGIPYIE